MPKIKTQIARVIDTVSGAVAPVEAASIAADAAVSLDELDVSIGEIDTRQHPVEFRGGGQPTPYQLSQMKDSSVEEAATSSDDKLFNARQPLYPIQHEKPVHRIVVHLKAAGYSHKQIAEVTGLTCVAVSNICRQPWAVQTIIRVIERNGGDLVQQRLAGAAVDAVDRLIVEMDNLEAPASTRITAADKLLTRLYGNPTQPIEHHVGSLENLTDDELAKIIASGSGGATPKAA